MVHNYIQSSLIHCPFDESFHMKGLTLHVEKNNSQFNPEFDYDENGEPVPLNIQIKRIDAIYNPEYERIKQTYKLPIFFKSLPVRSNEITHF